MTVMLRLLLLPGLLLAAAQPALAESPMPDPVAPAVIGRPLDQIGPARPARQKPAAAAPARTKPAASRPATSPSTVRRPVPPASSAAVTRDAPAGQLAPKRAMDDRADDRADPRTHGEVGKGTRFARKPLGPGAYFGDRHRAAVRKYYAGHPAPGAAASWQIGEPVPRGAPLKPLPQALLASLPALPPGHAYMQLGGEVVLIASGSRMVVDAISRSEP